MFRNLVDHPMTLLIFPLVGLLLLALVGYVIYRIVRAGVRDGHRDAQRRREQDGS